MKSNFLKRALTGILFVCILVGCMLYSPLSFGLLFTLIDRFPAHCTSRTTTFSSSTDIKITTSVQANRSGVSR